MAPSSDLGGIRRHLQRGEFVQAWQRVQPFLQRHPQSVEGWLRAGQSLHGLGNFQAAREAYQRALKLAPNDAELHLEMGKTLESAGLRDLPEASFRRAIELAPKRADGHVALGFRLLRNGDLAGAGSRFAAALQLDAQHVGAVAGAATVLERRRDLDSAWGLLEHATRGRSVDPRLAAATASVALRRGRAQDALPVVERGLRARGLTRTDRIHLLHAMGDLRDAMGHTSRAFAAWSKANAARSLSFDPDSHDRTVEFLCTCTPAEAFEPTSTFDGSDRAVFIVGAPRSGTSLVEQMLAAHRDVAGGGELHALRDAAVAIPAALGVEGSYLPHFGQLPADLLQDLARSYLNGLHDIDGTAVRITDKMPHNFFHLGLAAKMLPGARVVHCVRDPLDTLFSCYRQAFGPGLAYAADLTHLGRWYLAYQRLMAHWQEVLPLPIHTVRYEALVEQPEVECRKLLTHLDLPWDPRVLEFHALDRTVATASHAQVQQPLFRSSLGRAQRYRAHLEPLITVLAQGQPQPAPA